MRWVIALEGIDDVGKTTVAKQLKQCLSRQHDVVSLSYPGNIEGTLGAFVYQMHHGKTTVGQVEPVAMQMLHIAAHIDSINGIVRDSLDAGKLVLLDRFWWSTQAYGIANGIDREVVKAMIDIELSQWKAIPDVRIGVVYIVRESSGSEYDAQYKQKLLSEYHSIFDNYCPSNKLWLDNNGTVEHAINTILRFRPMSFA